MKTGFISLLALTLTLPLGAVTITASPDLVSYQLGSPVTVELTISGLSDLLPPSVSTYRVTLNFDGAILSPSSVAFGTQLDLGSGSIQIPTFGAGSVTLEEISLASTTDLQNLQDGSFTLASIVFDSISLGVSPLTVVVENLLDENGNPISFDVVNSTVTVVSSQVPEPSLAVPLVLCLAYGLFRQSGRRPGGP